MTHSSLKPEVLTAIRLFVLPQTARVEGDDVGQVVGHGGDLVGLVPRQEAEVVVAEGVAAPLVVRGHHEIAGQVVTALLTGAVVVRNTGHHAMLSACILKFCFLKIF